MSKPACALCEIQNRQQAGSADKVQPHRRIRKLRQTLPIKQVAARKHSSACSPSANRKFLQTDFLNDLYHLVRTYQFANLIVVRLPNNLAAAVVCLLGVTTTVVPNWSLYQSLLACRT